MIGNSYGLTTPTPLKTQFNKKRPGEPLTNSTIAQVATDWIADPTAAQFTNQNNFPYYDVIGVWNLTKLPV